MGDLPDGLYKFRSLQSNDYAENWPDNEPGVGIGNFYPQRKRNIWKITRNSNNNTYSITSADDSSTLTFIDRASRPPLLTQSENVDTAWKIENYGTYVSFYPDGASFRSQRVNTFRHSKYDYLCLSPNNPSSWSQRWEFQRVEEPGTTPPPKPTVKPPRDAASHYFPLSAEQARVQGPYDIIVVGTGIGGGVLAGELYDINVSLGQRAKKILVIERGTLLFQTHCLNGARPEGLDKDRGQQNDSFFADFKDDYTFSDRTNQQDWKGGPMYCLGGRSAAWGLFSPRIHDQTLKEFFPSAVAQDLLNEYYAKADVLMSVTLPVARELHQNLMNRLNRNSQENSNVQWQWGRIASNFCQAENFTFAKGAYSTIDKLLGIAMNKRNDADGRSTKFEMILGAEARKLTWTNGPNSAVKGVVVRTATGGECEIEVTRGSGKVVLCAGSVASPTILLRSGIDLTDPSMGGCRLTDHDIIFRAKSFRYTDPRKDPGSMKLQTYADLGGGHIVLSNMSIDASSFLPRGPVWSPELRKLIIVFIMRAPLHPQNTIKLVRDEPEVTIARSPYTRENIDLGKLKAVAESAMKAIEQELKVEFVDQPDDKNDFQYLQLGGVAHELGTLPMPMGDNRPEPYCLDSNLKLRGREGVYACDLSVFPYSPEVNPTPTLAALALRLARHLMA